MHEIELDGAERNICRNCVDDLWMGGKTDKLKKVGHSTVYRTYELEEDEEELERAVLGSGGEEVSIVPVVFPHGTVSISSLGYFLSVGYYSKPSHPSFPLYLGARHIQEYFKKKKRGRKRKCIEPQQEKASHEERMKQSMAIF